LQIKKKELEILNRRWESLLMACIGEQIDKSNIIGIVLSKRSKRNLLELWIKNRDEDSKVKLGEKLRILLELDPQNLTFYFKEHSKSLQVWLIVLWCHIYFLKGKIHIERHRKLYIYYHSDGNSSGDSIISRRSESRKQADR